MFSIPHLLAGVRQLHHTLLATLLLDGTGLKAELLRRDPHQLLGGPVSLGQRVANPAAVPIQEFVCIRHGGLKREQENILDKKNKSAKAGLVCLFLKEQMASQVDKMVLFLLSFSGNSGALSSYPDFLAM